jgi:hypothetical protein
MRMLTKLAVLGGLGYAAKMLYDRYMAPIELPTGAPIGRDTATGTDPNAKYSEPGYQDKSLGQAVQQDEQLVDRLMDETGGNVAEAEARFQTESAGAPAIARQEDTTRE